MDIRVLRYVIAVADRLNFTAAARALNVSQPALSQQIKLLEEELGIALFHRSSQGVTLTQGGRLVVDHARRVIGTAASLREEVEAFRGARRGRLRIGVTQSFNALHFPPILAELVSEHEGIDVTVLELANPRIVEGVAQGTLDIGIALGRNGDPAVATRPLYEDRLMLACRKGHRIATMAAYPLADLERETLALLTDDFVTTRELTSFFSLHGIVPGRIVSLNTFAAILSLVASSDCLSVIPTWADRMDVPMGVSFVPLTPSPPRRLTSIVLPAGGVQTPASRLVIDKLAERFSPGAWQAFGSTGDPGL